MKQNPVKFPFKVRENWFVSFDVSAKEIKKVYGFWPFTIPAGNRKYDSLVAQWRAAGEADVIVKPQDIIEANEAQWDKAAIAFQYGYSNPLLPAFKKYSPMTYDYSKR